MQQQGQPGLDGDAATASSQIPGTWNRVVDLRSDIATKPSLEMREVMMEALERSDILDEDPEVNGKR